MAWLESHTVLMRHRKLVELARKLRLRRSHAMGHLHALWHAALEQQDDGDLSEWTDELIAELSDYPGDAPQYVRLLQDTGFLGYRDPKTKVLLPGTERMIHDWLVHTGRFLTSRYSTSNRDRLVAIYAKHGLVYGSETRASGKREVSDPHQHNQPTHPPTKGGAAGRKAGEIAELAGKLEKRGVK